MPSDAPKEHGGFSYWVGVAFTVNYVIGCGFLAIPARFVDAGYLLGPIVIAVFVVVMNISKDYVLEAMGRAEAIASAPAIVARAAGGVGGGEDEGQGTAEGWTSLELSQGGGRSGDGDARDSSGATPAAVSYSAVPEVPALEDYLVTGRKFEIAALFALFQGKRARTWYVIILSGYMYGALWAYGTVFAASFAANVPVVFANGGETCDINTNRGACLPAFNTWLAVFALLAVPLACLELREQVAVQVFMFAARVLVVLLMCGTVMAGWWGCHDGGVVFEDLGPSTGGPAPGSAPFRLSGLPALLPVATYAFIFHHSVPVLAQPIADKRSLPSLFRTALCVCAVAYGALGLVVSLGFGSKINAQCNLNWQNYLGCAQSATASASGVAVAIRFVILIFPAVDVLSAYPLNAITLGNNLMCAILGDAEQAALAASGAAASASDDAAAVAAVAAATAAAGGAPLAWYVRTPRSRQLTRTAFRLLAAVPPIAAGAVSTAAGIDLDHILRFTGLIGVAIAFGVPAALALVSFAKTRAVFSALSAFPLAPAAEGSDSSGGESTPDAPLMGAAKGAGGGGGGVGSEGGGGCLASLCCCGPGGCSFGGGGSGSADVDAALRTPLPLHAYWRYDAARPAFDAALRRTPYTSWTLACSVRGRSGGRSGGVHCCGAATATWLRGDSAMAVFAVAAAGYIMSGLVQGS